MVTPFDGKVAVVISHWSAEGGAKVAPRIHEQNGNALFVRCDVVQESDLESGPALVERRGERNTLISHGVTLGNDGGASDVW